MFFFIIFLQENISCFLKQLKKIEFYLSFYLSLSLLFSPNTLTHTYSTHFQKVSSVSFFSLLLIGPLLCTLYSHIFVLYLFLSVSLSFFFVHSSRTISLSVSLSNTYLYLFLCTLSHRCICNPRQTLQTSYVILSRVSVNYLSTTNDFTGT